MQAEGLLLAGFARQYADRARRNWLAGNLGGCDAASGWGDRLVTLDLICIASVGFCPACANGWGHGLVSKQDVCSASVLNTYVVRESRGIKVARMDNYVYTYVLIIKSHTYYLLNLCSLSTGASCNSNPVLQSACAAGSTDLCLAPPEKHCSAAKKTLCHNVSLFVCLW